MRFEFNNIGGRIGVVAAIVVASVAAIVAAIVLALYFSSEPAVPPETASDLVRDRPESFEPTPADEVPAGASPAEGSGRVY